MRAEYVAVEGAGGRRRWKAPAVAACTLLALGYLWGSSRRCEVDTASGFTPLLTARGAPSLTLQLYAAGGAAMTADIGLSSQAVSAVAQSWNCTGPLLKIESVRVPTRAPWLYEANFRPYRCAELFALKSESAHWPPPKFETIDAQRQAQFTLNGLAELADFYINSKVYHLNGGEVNHWDTHDIEERVRNAKQGYCHTGYGDWTPVCAALKQYKSVVSGKHGLVLGSGSPWLESILLAYNATRLTTIEYATSTCQGTGGCERLNVIHPSVASKRFAARGFKPYQFAFSFSSYEHDGLGRYGDPLNAAGDLESMQKVRCMLQPGGLFFLGVPVNRKKDILSFNAHRIYGPARLPLLTAGWQVVDVVAPWWTELTKSIPMSWPPNGIFQPILVLRKPL